MENNWYVMQDKKSLGATWATFQLLPALPRSASSAPPDASLYPAAWVRADNWVSGADSTNK